MSLPIAEDEEDDDVDEPEHRTVRFLPVKSKSAAGRLPIVKGGEEDCYYCGVVFDKTKMKKIVMAGIPTYKCERC